MDNVDKYEVLSEYFGHSTFREGQEEIIDDILSGRDVLGIMPTGAGKSICYQVPALMLEGITVVVSPLISLMKDQVASLMQSGIKAAYINSSLTFAQYKEVFRRAYTGRYKIIYVAPERLITDEFTAFSKQMKISMVTVDEAHCVSQWGQDFRPGYLKIADYIDSLPSRPIVAAFTATATSEVKEDIIRLLRLQNPFTMTTGFDRKNLYFGVLKPKDKYMALKSILDDKRDKSGIVYCLARKTVEEVCDRLNRDGFAATRYHAGLSEEERHKNQDDFLYDRRTVMVATNAFGMGIDKSNVAYVVHYNMPANLESYYQEAGRAGRDGSRAECILLYSGRDVMVNQYLIEQSEENEELTPQMRRKVKENELEKLKKMTYYCTVGKCLREFMINYFDEDAPSFCGNCSNCERGFEAVDATETAQRIIACIERLGERNLHFGKTMIIDVLRGVENDRIRRFHLDGLSIHGILHKESAARLRAVIDFMLENGYLKTEGEHPVLYTCERAGNIAAGKERITVRVPVENTVYKSVGEESGIDQELFSELKALRMRLAARIHVPAYIIFTDASLKDMCRKRPTNRDELLRVSGVGAVRADKYGKEFCKLIAAYVSRKG